LPPPAARRYGRRIAPERPHQSEDGGQTSPDPFKIVSNFIAAVGVLAGLVALATGTAPAVVGAVFGLAAGIAIGSYLSSRAGHTFTPVALVLVVVLGAIGAIVGWRIEESRKAPAIVERLKTHVTRQVQATWVGTPVFHDESLSRLSEADPDLSSLVRPEARVLDVHHVAVEAARLDAEVIYVGGRVAPEGRTEHSGLSDGFTSGFQLCSPHGNDRITAIGTPDAERVAISSFVYFPALVIARGTRPGSGRATAFLAALDRVRGSDPPLEGLRRLEKRYREAKRQRCAA
jgi:hypothetical protein